MIFVRNLYELTLFKFNRERGGQNTIRRNFISSGSVRSASRCGAAIAALEVVGSREREFGPVRRICGRLVFVIYVKRAPRRENEGVDLTLLVL